jgi:hypothetical protein
MVLARLTAMVLARLTAMVLARLTAMVLARLTAMVLARLTAMVLARLTAMVLADLRVMHGAWGFDQPHTPNTDAFAQKALIFDNAYCNQAVCGPSRASLLSGRRPDSTQVRLYRLFSLLFDTASWFR